MNREIKFRAWDTLAGKFYKPTYKAYDGNLHDISITLNGVVMERTLDVNASMLNSENYILIQFTGLHDKNGKEIFEGDILKTSNNIVSVFFGKHISYVTMLGKKDTIETNGWLVKNAKVHIDVLDESFCNGEVIGNIYENLEFLNGYV